MKEDELLRHTTAMNLKRTMVNQRNQTRKGLRSVVAGEEGGAVKRTRKLQW